MTEKYVDIAAIYLNKQETAKKLGWKTINKFNQKLPELYEAGFPHPDPLLDNKYSLLAILEFSKKREKLDKDNNYVEPVNPLMDKISDF